MAIEFNPNELVLERIRAVEEYDPATSELVGRYTQIEEPTLNLSAEGTEVVDAMGATIATFYNAQKGTFGFNNSLFSLDLAASQFGGKKIVVTSGAKIKMPVSEILTIGEDHTVTLKYTPVGVKGSEIKYVKLINSNNTFGKTYTVTSTEPSGEQFKLEATSKKLTFPADTTGRVFINYTKETETAVQVDKTTTGVPQVKTLQIHAIFHDPCNTNLVYSSVIYVPRAQIDPSSIDLNLTPDGKHAASYLLNKEYCSEEGKLFTIFVSED